MKSKFEVCMIIMVVMVCLALLATTARAEYITGFETSDNSGYVIGNTVIGVDGWTTLGSGLGSACNTIGSPDPVNSGTQALGILKGFLDLVRARCTGPWQQCCRRGRPCHGWRE